MKSRVDKIVPLATPVKVRFAKTRKISGIISALVLTILAILLYLGQRPAAVTLASIQTTPKVESEVPMCESDSDCILVTRECCACDQGGEKAAINRKYYSYWLNKKHDSCIFASCRQVFSEDLTCSPKAKARCVNSVCKVK